MLRLMILVIALTLFSTPSHTEDKKEINCVSFGKKTACMYEFGMKYTYTDVEKKTSDTFFKCKLDEQISTGKKAYYRCLSLDDYLSALRQNRTAAQMVFFHIKEGGQYYLVNMYYDYLP